MDHTGGLLHDWKRWWGEEEPQLNKILSPLCYHASTHLQSLARTLGDPKDLFSEEFVSAGDRHVEILGPPLQPRDRERSAKRRQEKEKADCPDRPQAGLQAQIVSSSSVREHRASRSDSTPLLDIVQSKPAKPPTSSHWEDTARMFVSCALQMPNIKEFVDTKELGAFRALLEISVSRIMREIGSGASVSCEKC